MLTLRNLESSIFLTKNMLSDDFWAGGAQRNDAAGMERLNEYTFDSEHSNIKDLFSGYYSVIYYCNVAIAHVNPDTPVKKRVVEESRVLRAWAHFELASLWGDPPIVDHELEASEYAQPNSTDEQLPGDRTHRGYRQRCPGPEEPCERQRYLAAHQAVCPGYSG